MCKQWLSVLLALILLLSVLGGCAPKKEPSADVSSPATTQSTTITTTTAATTDTTTSATAPTTAVPAKDMTAAQAEDIEEFLNKTENNGLVGGGNLYAAPQEVSLNAMFYDGGGVGTWDMTTWSEEEKQALLKAGGWEEFYIGVIKLPAAAVAKAVEEKLGIPQAAVSVPLDYHYLEAYDAYYDMHSDTAFEPITVTGGKVSGDVYTVYYVATDKTQTYTVVLQKAETGYRFVSNKAGQKD